ncbi:MAG: TolC family protein [Phycisphaerales bacterium]|nr:TolC family protein [Phycisphaerales bacterium]MCB9857200.1 TolC family protein [Phycisphaerales bacterium]MCB9863087.1 TolC family protein [Phycisphaerales bacterium]
MQQITIIATGLAILLGVGCSDSYSTTKQDVSLAQQWQRRRVSPPPPAHGPSPTTGNRVRLAPRDPEGLVEYTMLALERNPAIAGALADVEAKLERIPQVTSLEDPMLRLVARPEPIQTAAGDIVFTLAASQKIPLPKKLDLKGKMAAEDVREAIERLNAVRLRIIADVQHAYYRIYVSDRAIEITQQNAALLLELERVASAQFEVGKADQQDVLRIQTELSELDNALIRYRGQRVSAVAAINQLMDRTTTTDIGTLPPLDGDMFDARVEELLELGKRHNPELAALAHRSRRDQLGANLADLSYVPDVTLGFEWNHADGRAPFVPPVNPQTRVRPPYNDASAQGDDNWALTIGVNLPIWAQRNEAARREALKRIEATDDDRRSMQRMIEFRIHDAWARIETDRSSVELLETTIIPQARQSYDASLLAYQEGTEKFITVIDNWRKLLLFELMKHRDTASMQTALADLQREIGASLVSPGNDESKVAS